MAIIGESGASNEKVQSHRDLRVWEMAMDLAVDVYKLTSSFPSNEIYRLTSQLTRAAASVPANIVEGNARGSRRDYANFVAIAKGSLMETETFLTLASRLNYVSEEKTRLVFALITDISKMLTSLRKRLLVTNGLHQPRRGEATDRSGSKPGLRD